ncbi:MAG: 50S ribosomal protein L31 [Candidatus Kerfeldbacteria bacterium RIFCSPHIGHO2_12_FULL_48_17]|uniref:Large ribosomal subunit protein bL31 n=1 Tax=Candidatus Kerfeldbacteria bacterium RIFCSPHIGHO2_12_FULL_48_17 TaxID=1798542 RepID=A0A1G2B916_9BACT|nr:MAG: 50S ribosomal protein L31 [Candidatus Kerfeldbacteria bacterium RIFCSPHIGHO2_12_FULL_48_17]
MKKDIHPGYQQTQVTCACGNTFMVGSTIEAIQVEICSKCHPFYTGKQKLIDTARRVEKYQAKQARVKEMQATKSALKKAKKPAKKKVEDDTPLAEKVLKSTSLSA